MQTVYLVLLCTHKQMMPTLGMQHGGEVVPGHKHQGGLTATAYLIIGLQV